MRRCAGAPAEDLAAVRREGLWKLEEEPDALEALVEDDLAGNRAPAYRRLEDRAREDKEPAARQFKEAFVDDRNRTMVERMTPLLERGKAFVAVGALHMPGDEGILHLLEQQGWRVTRVY